MIESGTYLHWTYDFEWTKQEVNAAECVMQPDMFHSSVQYTTGYVIIPYSWYQSHKSTVDDGINEVMSSHSGGYAKNRKITKLIKDEILGGSFDYSPVEVKPWQDTTSCIAPIDIKAEGSGMDKYLIIGVGCLYHWELAHGERSSCEVATSETIIYNCDYCGEDTCLLDYLSHNNDWIDAYYTKFGSSICIKEGTEHGICESTADCKNLVSMPDRVLGSADHTKPYYSVTAVRCEKESPGDPKVSFINNFLIGGAKGTCEFGAKRPYDCEYLFGNPSSYEIITKDGGYNSQRSYWAVQNSKCILGECNGFSACYDLYNSVYYDCVSKQATSNGLVSTYGVCEQKQWTTAQIQQKCEEAEGKKPTEGYAWYVDEDGECYLDRPTDSECNTATDCECLPTEIAICQKIQTAYGEVGKCKCKESGGGVEPTLCGDHICDTLAGETPQNCPQDCGSPSDDPGSTEPDEGENPLAWVVGLLIVIAFIVLVLLLALGVMKLRSK